MHSCGGFMLRNPGYANPSVTGLVNYCLCQARVPHVFTILVRTLEMPLNNKARAANLIIIRPSYFEYSYPRMSILLSLLRI